MILIKLGSFVNWVCWIWHEINIHWQQAYFTLDSKYFTFKRFREKQHKELRPQDILIFNFFLLFKEIMWNIHQWSMFFLLLIVHLWHQGDKTINAPITQTLETFAPRQLSQTAVNAFFLLRNLTAISAGSFPAEVWVTTLHLHIFIRSHLNP